MEKILGYFEQLLLFMTLNILLSPELRQRWRKSLIYFYSLLGFERSSELLSIFFEMQTFPFIRAV